MEIKYAYTDTIAGGEPNYSWVKTGAFKVKRGTSDLSICRIVKKAVGLNGVRGKMVNQGEYRAFYPSKSATILFWNKE